MQSFKNREKITKSLTIEGIQKANSGLNNLSVLKICPAGHTGKYVSVTKNKAICKQIA